MSETIEMNVGGTLMKTLKSTLEKSEYFKSMLSRWNDNKEVPFIDDDPNIFIHVLNIMRFDKVPEALDDNVKLRLKYYLVGQSTKEVIIYDAFGLSISKTSNKTFQSDGTLDVLNIECRTEIDGLVISSSLQPNYIKIKNENQMQIFFDFEVTSSYKHLYKLKNKYKNNLILKSGVNVTISNNVCGEIYCDIVICKNIAMK